MEIRDVIKFVMVLGMAGVMIACGGKEKKREAQVIPPDELVPVLEDIYLADGVFSLRYLRRQFPGTDSMSNYRDILMKYGYTVEDMKKTIDHYTDDNNMQELEAVYEVVLKDLRELLEKTFEEEHAPRPATDTSDLWNLKREFHLPREGQRNKIPFAVPVRGPGVYSLKIKIRISTSDGSKRPYIHLWFWRDDGTKEGERIEWDKRRVPKDGRWHQFVLAKKLTDPAMTHIKGFLADDENKDTTYIKRVDVKGIRLDMRPLLVHGKIPVAK
jgi:hypothetical protein